MSKRHTLRSGDLESVIGRLQELVLANSGEDEFEEIFKLLVAKLLSEIQPELRSNFRVLATPKKTSRAINGLLEEAEMRWTGILNSHPKSNLTEEHLTICVEVLQNQSLLETNLEILDAAFEYLVSQTAKGSKGQYFTPRHVIDCCVRMINPLPHEKVLDPACGSSGFLIHTLNYVRNQNPSLDISQYCEDNLWGCDFDNRALRVAKALMLIVGNSHANLFRVNSLLSTNHISELFDFLPSREATPKCTIEAVVQAKFPNFSGFDVILTNPPFAGEVREQEVLSLYDLADGKKRVERDILFLERCVRLLRPGGRLAVILPHNKFSSPMYAYARDWLIRNLRVVAMLGLGRNTFLPHTHQKASILFGIKREHSSCDADNEDILFLISDKDGKDSRGKFILRPHAQVNDSAWERVEHDLGELTITFKDFVKSHNIPWSVL